MVKFCLSDMWETKICTVLPRTENGLPFYEGTAPAPSSISSKTLHSRIGSNIAIPYFCMRTREYVGGRGQERQNTTFNFLGTQMYVCMTRPFHSATLQMTEDIPNPQKIPSELLGYILENVSKSR